MNTSHVMASSMACVVLSIGCGGQTVDITGPTPTSGSSTNSVVTASGRVITEMRPVTGFRAVSIGVPGRMTIDRNGNSGSLTIIGDENVLSVITSVVEDGELTIAQTPNTDLRLNDPLEIEYRVTMEELTRLQASGLVVIVGNGIAGPELDVVVNGSSSVTLNGSVGRHNVLLSGNSRYETEDLISREAAINVTGSSFALLNVSETLSGQVSGTSVVRYLGNPSVSVSVSGAGSVGPR